MTEIAERKRRRWSWKRTVGILVCLAALVVVTLVALPGLLPDAAVRRQVEAILADRLGRPVTVESARLAWDEGLTATGLRIGQREGDQPLATASRVTVRFGLLDAAKSVVGRDVPLKHVRIEGLELWLVLDAEQRLNVDDLLREPARIRAVQVSDATVHVENRHAGRRLTLRHLHATLGELASTRQGYLSLSADLGDGAAGQGAERPGHVVVTANLERLRFGGTQPVPATFKAEWTDIPWSQVAAVAGLEPRWVGALARTSGRMSASVGRGAWSAEGAVQATGLVLASDQDPEQTVTMPQAVLGFQLQQASAEAPLDITLAKFSAPGIDLKVSGHLQLENPPAAPDAQAGRAAWTIHQVDLRAEGAVSWVPLCQSVGPLARLAKEFDRLGGRAWADLRLETTRDGPRLTGSVDFSDTFALWQGALRKDERQLLRLEVDATCTPDLGQADLTRLEVVTDAGRLSARGQVPVATFLRPPADPSAADPLSRRLQGARLAVHVGVDETETLLALVPALGRRLGPVQVSGPFSLDLTCAPAEGVDAPPDAPPAWIAKVRGDLTPLVVSVPHGAQKPTGAAATLDAMAVLMPDAFRSDVVSLTARLDKGALRWAGSARIDWPQKKGEQPVGRFDGTLTASDVASAGAVVSPARFGAAPLVSGGATFDVTADLAEGRLRTRMTASLEPMAIRLANFFVKDQGQPASLDVTTRWHTGTWNRLEAEAQVDLPGARLAAKGEGEVQVKLVDLPAPAPAADAAPAPPGTPAPAAPDRPQPTSSLEVKVISTGGLDIEAHVDDLAKAAALSPLLAAHLEGYRAEGRAEGHLTLRAARQAVEARGNLDLTDTDLGLGRLLRKPAGRPMTVEVAGDVSPAPDGALAIRLTGVDVRLGDSVVRAQGWARVDWTGLTAPLDPTARLAAALKAADLSAKADWNHGPDLAKDLPWLEPVYARCGLAGPTTWSVAFSGTPIRGKVRCDVDATECQVTMPQAPAADGGAAGPVVLKAAHVPAAVGMDLRYGEVPGEMILDRFDLKLADATASAQGVLLFDDPRLVLLRRPTAWSVQVRGRVPDAQILASLLPAHLADLRPTGAVAIDLRAAADPKAAQVESCDLAFQDARIAWRGKTIRLDGPIAYNHQRLATEGLSVRAGDSDVTLVAYVANPNDDPTGSVVVRGKAVDITEVQEMLQEAGPYLDEARAAAPKPKAGDRLSDRFERLLAGARLSADIRVDRVSLVVPQWKTRYDLTDLSAEGRLADQRFAVPRFACTLNEGTVTGQMAIDFGADVPLLTVAYDARNLKMAENLKPFIDTTFPGMEVVGTLSTRASTERRLAEGAHPVGRSETVLTDGVLRGPGAPEYMTRLLPGLKLTEFAFNRMSNVSEQKPNGDVDNRMLFDGKAYDVYIFGVTRADGHTAYTLGVDLSVSLGSKVISRTLDQGKLPLMHYTGRIVGSQFAEQQVSYVLPHEFAYDVFIRRNLLLQLIRSLGQKEPEIERPVAVPKETVSAMPNVAGP